MTKILSTTKVLMMIMMLSIPTGAFAWGNDHDWGGGGGSWGGGGGTNVPLDGGLSLLLAAGAGYGIKQYASRKKNAKEQK